MIGRTSLLVPLAMLAATLAPAVATAAPAGAAASPKALSLTVKDVQHLYGKSFRPFISNTYKASKLRTCGSNYSGGYLATFGNFAKARKSGGVVSVESTVFAYPDSRSANCMSAAYGKTMTRNAARSGSKVHESALSGVGDAALLFTVTTPKAHAYSVMIWLFRGTHVAMVTVSAVGSPPAPSGAIALAKDLDARIQAAG